MQSTENDTQIADVGALIARAEEYARPEPFLPKTTGNYEIVRGLLAALATERARADQAEAKLADAWDTGAEYAVDYSTAPLYDNPYRSEATA